MVKDAVQRSVTERSEEKNVKQCYRHEDESRRRRRRKCFRHWSCFYPAMCGGPCRTDIHAAAFGRPHAGAGGDALKDDAVHEEPTVEQVLLTVTVACGEEGEM